jgi:hypothetical protein
MQICSFFVSNRGIARREWLVVEKIETTLSQSSAAAAFSSSRASVIFLFRTVAYSGHAGVVTVRLHHAGFPYWSDCTASVRPFR